MCIRDRLWAVTLVAGKPATNLHSLPIAAYNCDDIQFQRAIYIGGVAPCQPPTDNAPSAPPTKISAAVVQAISLDNIEILACRVKILSSICRCGMHSHCSSPIDGVTEDYFSMSRDDCLRAHNEKRWIYFDKMFIGLQVNGTFRQSVTIRGTKDAAGTCNGASFTFRGTSYD